MSNDYEPTPSGLPSNEPLCSQNDTPPDEEVPSVKEKPWCHGFTSVALGVLWFAWAVFFFGGIIGALPGLFSERDVYVGFLISTVILAASAWAIFGVTCCSRAVVFSVLIAVGMTFGALADLYGGFSHLLPVAEPMLVIIPLFALGHIAYITATFFARCQLGRGNWKVWWITIAFCMTLGFVIWCLIAFSGEYKEILRWPALGYTLLLSATTGTMCGLFFADRRFLAMALGGILFLISDTVLGVSLFHDSRGLEPLVLLTYGPAQMFIVFGTAIAFGEASKGHLLRNRAAIIYRI